MTERIKGHGGLGDCDRCVLQLVRTGCTHRYIFDRSMMSDLKEQVRVEAKYVGYAIVAMNTWKYTVAENGDIVFKFNPVTGLSI